MPDDTPPRLATADDLPLLQALGDWWTWVDWPAKVAAGQVVVVAGGGQLVALAVWVPP